MLAEPHNGKVVAVERTGTRTRTRPSIRPEFAFLLAVLFAMTCLIAAGEARPKGPSSRAVESLDNSFFDPEKKKKAELPTSSKSPKSGKVREINREREEFHTGKREEFREGCKEFERNPKGLRKCVGALRDKASKEAKEKEKAVQERQSKPYRNIEVVPAESDPPASEEIEWKLE